MLRGRLALLQASPSQQWITSTASSSSRKKPVNLCRTVSKPAHTPWGRCDSPYVLSFQLTLPPANPFPFSSQRSTPAKRIPLKVEPSATPVPFLVMAIAIWSSSSTSVTYSAIVGLPVSPIFPVLCGTILQMAHQQRQTNIVIIIKGDFVRVIGTMMWLRRRGRCTNAFWAMHATRIGSTMYAS